MEDASLFLTKIRTALNTSKVQSNIVPLLLFIYCYDRLMSVRHGGYCHL